MPRKRIYRKEVKKLRRLVPNFQKIKEAVRKLHVKPYFVKYWKKKYSDHSFHPNKHGGVRWRKFSLEELHLIKYLIWEKVKVAPLSR